MQYVCMQNIKAYFKLTFMILFWFFYDEFLQVKPKIIVLQDACQFLIVGEHETRDQAQGIDLFYLLLD